VIERSLVSSCFFVWAFCSWLAWIYLAIQGISHTWRGREREWERDWVMYWASLVMTVLPVILLLVE